MRTGAIFARGSCRALKWIALFGVMLALGAGSAAAQITITVADEVDEGARVAVTVGGTVSIPAGNTGDTVTITGTSATRTGTAPVTDGDAEDNGGMTSLVIRTPPSTLGVPNHPVSGTFYWQVGVDTDAEDEAVELTFTATPAGGVTATLAATSSPQDATIEDAQEQSFVWGSVPTNLKEGGMATLTLTAVPAPVQLTHPTTLSVDTVGYTVSTPGTPPNTHDFGTGAAASVTITLTAPGTDRNRVDDTIVLRAAETGGVTARAAPLSLDVEDIHQLPAPADITAVAYDAVTGGDMVTSVEEGDEVYIEVEVDRGTNGYPTGEGLEVTLGLSDASLGTFDGTGKVTIASGNGKKNGARVKLTVADLNTFPQAEMLVVSLNATGATPANGSGSVEGIPLSLPITDATVAQVSVKGGAMAALYGARDAAKGPDGMLNPGDDFSVDNDMLFDSADGFTFQVDARSSMSTVVSVDDSSGDSISVMPESVGTAMVTLTATALPETSSFRGTQVSESVATIEFEVEVEAVPTAAPDTPAAPTVATPKAQGALDVSWTAPNDNGSPITGYGLRYKMSSGADWAVMSASVTGTSTTLTGLSAGTSYDVQVNATNADGTSGWSMSGTGTTAAAPVNAAPDAPAAPTVTTAKAQGSLDVSWTAPNDNGSPITGYGLQYKMSSAADWTVMSASVTGTSTTLTGLSAGMSYDVQVNATNANGSSAWSKSGTGSTAAAPVEEVKRGQLTKFELVGDGVDEKTIGGVKRYHVPEGSQYVDLSVTVQWTHAEILAIGYNTAQTIEVEIMSGGSTLPNWVSWIDGEGDVHFPRAGSLGNLTGGVVTVKTPQERDVPAAQRGSERHVKEATGKLDVLILHDDHEAENDAFYIQATGGNVDLNAPRGVNAVTPEVVIEDDEDQTVTVKMGTRTSSTVYEGDSGDDVPTFTVAASPARVDLPLEVRLDMVDLGGTTVSSGEISLSKSAMTLNDGSTGNSDTVTVHLPASDGNRVDNDYELHASVNVYSLASGGYETLPAASHPIKVIDRHKLPTLMVSPPTGTVKEGGMIELTLTINRNPSNTPVSSTEKLQYTQEEVSIMLDMGAGSTAGAADFSVMTNPLVFPKRERGSYTASMTVEVMATADNELDDKEMLVLDAMVAGSVDRNGSEKDSHMGVSTLTIEESTAKLVWAKTQDEVEAAVYAAKNAGMGDDMTFNPGDMIEIMGSALFNAAEGVTVSYSAMTSDNNVASTSVDSAGMAMVTAMGAGMADITITAHASMPSGVKILDQTDPSQASIMFPVEVGLEALTLMLTGPEDMNVVEGGMGAMVTVTANRAVTEDVTVTLMRDRAMSTAGDADFTAEPIVIAAGMMTGSTMVMAVEDGMMESVDNMAEELVLYGMAEGMAGEVSGQVKLYLWDAAVPALPVIAQLLLAALMAVGGYRRYRRR